MNNFETEALWFFSVYDEAANEWVTIHRHVIYKYSYLLKNETLRNCLEKW
jgi:hypothetical protein